MLRALVRVHFVLSEEGSRGRACTLEALQGNACSLVRVDELSHEDREEMTLLLTVTLDVVGVLDVEGAALVFHREDFRALLVRAYLPETKRFYEAHAEETKAVP